MNVCMIGTGYVGLVSGACFAEFGVQVVCTDNDDVKVAALQSGSVPIYEPGLEELVERNVRQGRLSFTTDTAEAINSSLVVFIAVSTPSRPEVGIRWSTAWSPHSPWRGIGAVASNLCT